MKEGGNEMKEKKGKGKERKRNEMIDGTPEME